MKRMLNIFVQYLLRQWRVAQLGTLTAAIILLLAVAARSQGEKFSKYRTVEAYEVRPGILMMPRYTADGQVCEIGLEVENYSAGVIRLNPSFSRTEIQQIADELVPASERGPKSKQFGGRDQVSMSGGALITSSMYENITIQVYSAALPSSAENTVVADNVAATIRWNNRRCR